MKRIARLIGAVAAAWLMVLGSFPAPASAAAGTCTPSGNYGSATQNVTVASGGTYVVWSRMATDDAANKSYMLQIDDDYCFTVGSSGVKTVPVYASGDTTRFNNDSSNWLKTEISGAAVSIPNLTAGTHQVTLIGNAPNVVVDRLIFTQDTSCVPTGTGDNCAIAPDTTPPTVNITAPAANATIGSTTNVTASATDGVAVTSVEFYVDGVLKATDTAAPYAYSFNPSTVSIGGHQLTAKAYDAAGNSATSSIVQVTVPDTIDPVVSITSPVNNATVSGTINIAATATDNVAVQKVEFYADGSSTALGTDTTGTSNSYAISTSTASLSNGTHTVTAKAYDAAGNITTSTVTVTVNNTSTGGDTTAPTVSIAGITAGAYLNINSRAKPYNSASYPVSSLATDASGIKNVVFKLNGATTATIGTAPFNTTLNLTTLMCGNQTVTATATDNATAANNRAASVTFFATYAEDIIPQTGCKVDFLDLSALAGKYGQSGSGVGRADINGDGTVNFLDLSALSSRYGQ